MVAVLQPQPDHSGLASSCLWWCGVKRRKCLEAPAMGLGCGNWVSRLTELGIPAERCFLAAEEPLSERAAELTLLLGILQCTRYNW